MIKCGKCKGYHATVAAVKLCCEQPVEFSLYGDTARGTSHQADSRAVDMAPASAAAIYELNELLATKVAPEAERRYAKAVREMLERGNATGYAVRSAIARMEPWENVRAGGGRASAAHAGHRPDAGQWSSADRERAQVARAQENGPSHEGLYRLSRTVTLFDGKVVEAGTLVQVLRGKGSQKLYANTVEFNGATTKTGHPKPDLCYIKGLIFKVLDSELLPVEEAEELTQKTGWCVFGHFLTNPVSIARGMGPKCYERYPHLARNAA